MTSPDAIRIAIQIRDHGYQHRFDDDDVIDFMVREALIGRLNEFEDQQREQFELDQRVKAAEDEVSRKRDQRRREQATG